MRLANAFLYDELVVSWCGTVTQPDIIAEIADFFIRFDQVNWSLAAGVFEDQLKLSLRAGSLGGRAGETLHAVVNGLGSAGGHDKRAGGAIVLPDLRPETVEIASGHGPPPPARPTAHRRTARTSLCSTVARSFRPPDARRCADRRLDHALACHLNRGNTREFAHHRGQSHHDGSSICGS